MKAKEVKQLSVSDLKEKFAQEKENLGKMKFNHAISPLDSPIRIREVRKTVARLATELRERENKEKATK